MCPFVTGFVLFSTVFQSVCWSLVYSIFNSFSSHCVDFLSPFISSWIVDCFHFLAVMNHSVNIHAQVFGGHLFSPPARAST